MIVATDVVVSAFSVALVSLRAVAPILTHLLRLSMERARRRSRLLQFTTVVLTVGFAAV